MTGITVGVDGSHGAHRALEWAMEEAAVRHARLTVLTVHEVAASAWTGGFARLLMGSVSNQVVHHAHCPVVVVPDQR